MHSEEKSPLRAQRAAGQAAGGRPICIDSIPQAIKGLRQWLVWRTEERDGKPTKVPYRADGQGRASSTDPDTWAYLGHALHALEAGDYDGLGFVFTLESGIVGIDLDKCRDPETGKIEEWALRIIRRLNSYTEISPSGTGIHILARGKLPPGRNRQGKIEMYSQGRYFTVTGWRLESAPCTIEERSSELASLHAETFAPVGTMLIGTTRARPAPTLEDGDVIGRAMAASNGHAFKKLWTGDIAGYPSASEADLALCCHLAFWSSGDAPRMDRLFRQSGLMRPKWDECRGAMTYGQRTIERALTSTLWHYGQPRALPSLVRRVGAPLPTRMRPRAIPVAEILRREVSA